jgi:hypothetical protein
MLKLDQGQPPGWKHMELNYTGFQPHCPALLALDNNYTLEQKEF